MKRKKLLATPYHSWNACAHISGWVGEALFLVFHSIAHSNNSPGRRIRLHNNRFLLCHSLSGHYSKNPSPYQETEQTECSYARYRGNAKYAYGSSKVDFSTVNSYNSSASKANVGHCKRCFWNYKGVPGSTYTIWLIKNMKQ